MIKSPFNFLKDHLCKIILIDVMCFCDNVLMLPFVSLHLS